MPLIHLTTFIAAPVERVFDLSRSIDLHKHSMQAFDERPVAGKISGLIALNETVTWQAKHLFKKRRLQVKITDVQAPFSFIDEQVAGDFKSMRHEHYFKPCDNGTIMIDKFLFETPYGYLGHLVNKIWLSGYMERLLEKRNEIIKKTAESNLWNQFI
jgi:ligand-binding SRPBCC domain-containing protein